MTKNKNNTVIDYNQLYNNHDEYITRRINDSHAHAQVLLEVQEFKIPNLLSVLPDGFIAKSLLEIGSATGELVAHFPKIEKGRCVGCDISVQNIECSKQRYPGIDFFSGDFKQVIHETFDLVILSDILEHVEDDEDFLKAASTLANFTLVNLPLEDNWLNRNRAYGPDDSSGHLRKYSYEQGLKLFNNAGMKVVNHKRIWIHETDVLYKLSKLREKFIGKAYSGSRASQLLKPIILNLAKRIRPVGRKLFASNLFILAIKEKIENKPIEKY